MIDNNKKPDEDGQIIKKKEDVSEKLKKYNLDKKKIITIAVVAVVFLFVMIKSFIPNKEKPKTTNSTNSTLQVNSSALLQKSIDQKISQIANATANNTQSIRDLKNIVTQMQNNTASQSAPLPSLPSTPPPATQQTISQPPPAPVTPPPPPPPARIESITIKQPKEQNATESTNNTESKSESQNYVDLPDGSIVKVTLVSGIYAPVTASQSLPTLFNVDEMFYGPNHTRIPLKACKVLAKAQGNQATQRAFVDAYELSCVLPNGESKHFDISGYISSRQDSAYGLKGKIVSVTGKYITGSFLAGVLQGFGQAMSMANQNSSLTTSGTVETSVNGGQVGKYSGYAGLAGGANALSQYYANKLNELVDMIYVPAGTKAYLIVNKGALIKGYKLNSINKYGYAGVD